MPAPSPRRVLGAFRRAHRLSGEPRHVRARLTVRDALVRTRTGSIAVLRSLLRQHGWRVRTGALKRSVAASANCRCPAVFSLKSPSPGGVMRHVNHQLANSDERVETITARDPRVRQLRTVPSVVPSVGPVTAAAFVPAIDEVTRFRRAHELGAYLGLVPREHSSGDTLHRGRITKAGPTRVRRLLVQATVSMLRCRHPHTEDSRARALRIAARRGKKSARVALARRLAGILDLSRIE